MLVRQRTALPAVLYGLYLVALGLSFRCASRALSLSSTGVMRAVWGWVEAPRIQKVLQG